MFKNNRRNLLKIYDFKEEYFGIYFDIEKKR